MEAKDLVSQSMSQLWRTVDRALDGLSQEELAVQPKPDCNSMGWTAWHMGQVEDRFIHANFQKRPRLFETGWAEKLGIPVDGSYRSVESLKTFPTPTPESLNGYLLAIRRDTQEYLNGLTPAQLDQEVEMFGRKSTIGQACGGMIAELHQHAGQLSYLRGFLRGFQS